MQLDFFNEVNVPDKFSMDYYSDARHELLKGGRVVVWFSCGATSAVASKLAVMTYKKRPVHVVYCDTGSEHESNKVFLKDVEKWIDHPIEILKSSKYEDIWDVFEKTKFLVGPHGARCTTELKKKLRIEYEQADSDIQVFGYSWEEQARANKFRNNFPEVYLRNILIDRGLTKVDCLALIKKAGIELPLMYKQGYDHNNCIGCPKGFAGYWNKIRVDYPETFNRMAKVERKLNISIIRQKIKGQKERKRIFLDELDPNAGNFKTEPPIQCGPICDSTFNEMEGDK